MEMAALLLLVLFQFFGPVNVKPYLPDPQLTPGVIASTDTKAICATKWGRDERHVTQKMKLEVCAEYHAQNCPKAQVWEIDHLVSRELGGADDIKNLWPQSAPSFHWKDRLENRMHVLVCSGELPLAQAQRDIARDWPAAYRKYVGPVPVK